jgi:retron-type reverse transcriptase
VEQVGVEGFLEQLGAVLRAGEYPPSATLRRYIPKADGKQRPLEIPTVRDRVVQMAAKLVLEPIFGADCLPCSYGYRPKRSYARRWRLGADAARSDIEANVALRVGRGGVAAFRAQ